jgi:hypothetical protein
MFSVAVLLQLKLVISHDLGLVRRHSPTILDGNEWPSDSSYESSISP